MDPDRTDSPESGRITRLHVDVHADLDATREIRAADTLERSEPLPTRMAELDWPSAEDVAETRTFELDGFSSINGQQMDMGRIDAVVTKDTTELWELHNAANTYHNFHVHDVYFRVLDVDGQPPPPEMDGWKDTVFLPPGTTARIIAGFEDYADPSNPYMFHCHILSHEDAGMMGQFVTVEPDE